MSTAPRSSHGSRFVTCHLIGGLGTQLFQIAAAYAKACQFEREFFLPDHAHEG
jgi:hypothetical protein